MEWSWAAAVGDHSRKNLWRCLLRGQNLAASPEVGGAQDILARASGLLANCPSSSQAEGAASSALRAS